VRRSVAPRSSPSTAATLSSSTTDTNARKF
jgi:hypothetical protein